jgi:ADP-L-glycero-D-manno-heptose 6-epimerase
LIVVTGGAGFIGSNLLRKLNQAGREDIILVDDLTDGRKIANIADCRIADYLDKGEWRALLESGGAVERNVECIYHLGACSDTRQWDGRHMMDTNFAYSRATFDFCARNAIALVYASSAAVYGDGAGFEEAPQYERPLNVYGYSKLVFDQYVRRRLGDTDSLVAGLRYFNVYGPREQHKGPMASVAWHFNGQMRASGKVRLFQASHGYGDGEQKRDFIYVEDAVDVTLWFGRQGPGRSGVFNCGTGRAESFNAVADAVIDWYGRGAKEYVEFPPELGDVYQAFTQADLSRLRAAGYERAFRSVVDGVREYLNWLNS